MEDRYEMKTKVWAHRGASAYAPENTLEAFLLAAEQGADGVELDVQLTKDGVPVVFHDWDLKRAAGVDRKIRDCTFEELQSYRLFGSSQTIPAFETVLELADGPQKQLASPAKQRPVILFQKEHQYQAAALCMA